jgi:hypothetical protein
MTFVYTKTCVAGPSSLFSVGTVTRVMITLLVLLRLTSFLSLYIGLEHGLHKCHSLVTPKLLVGLLGLSGLTCCCLKGLTIVVIATSVQGVVGLVGTALGFATLAKLLTVTLLWDSTSWPPRCLPLGITLGFRPGCSILTFALSLLFCFSTMTLSMASRSGNNARVKLGTVRWVRLD